MWSPPSSLLALEAYLSTSCVRPILGPLRSSGQLCGDPAPPTSRLMTRPCSPVAVTSPGTSQAQALPTSELALALRFPRLYSQPPWHPVLSTSSLAPVSDPPEPTANCSGTQPCPAVGRNQQWDSLGHRASCTGAWPHLPCSSLCMKQGLAAKWARVSPSYQCTHSSQLATKEGLTQPT